MFESFASALAGAKEASPQLLLGVAVASGVVLFSPDSFIASVGLSEFTAAHRSYLGGAFIGSLALLFSFIVVRAIGAAKSALAARKSKAKREAVEAARRKMLHDLTPDEKAYLAPYIFGEENTQYFLIADGVAGGLKNKGVIYQASSIGSLIDGWAFNMQPWAREYLRERPELLEGASPDPSGPPRW